MNNQHFVSPEIRSAGSKTSRLLDFLASMALVLMLFSFAYLTAHGVFWVLAFAGLHLTPWQQMISWYVVGFLLQLYWPFRYLHNMRGNWGGFFFSAIFCSVFGPFAFFLGMPL